MKVIFMGTPDFAVPALQNLIDNPNYEVVAVFSQPPKKQGRNLKTQASPVQQLAQQHNIQTFTPSTLKIAENQSVILNIGADVIIVAAYGFIIPKVILDSKKYGCINIHPSSLPRHRGAAPLQHSILQGDKTSSVCIMQMDEGLDTGDILLEEIFALPEDITLKQLHDQCAKLGADILLQTLDNIENIPPTPQSSEGVTYAHKISKQDGLIDWKTMDAPTIDRMIRALTPWPGVFFNYQGMHIKILNSKIVHNNNKAPAGTVIDNQLTIACRSGYLQITTLQKPGKKPVSASDFLNGTHIPVGSKL